MSHYRATSSGNPLSPLRSAVDRVSSATAATLVQSGAVVFFTALTGASAALTVVVPWTAVPFTMQPAAVLLAGAVLGARLGAVSQVLYLALGVVGASMFAASPQLLPGAARLVGPTGGFLLAFPLAAWVTGSLADRGWTRRTAGSVSAMTAGLAALYAGGLLWLGVLMPAAPGVTAAAAAMAPFAGADLVKAVLVAVALPVASRAFGPRD
jgi:biotin transport system substrate-specific component